MRILVFIFSLLVLCSCNTETLDSEKPVIDLEYAYSFPNQCDTLYFNTEYRIRIYLSDDVELGAFRYDIHHNFDHHTHTTEQVLCELDEKKTAITPFLLKDNYSIPDNRRMYITDIPLFLPAQNSEGEVYDAGDYHFFMSVTDKFGWSSSKSLSIKVLHAE